MLSLITAVWTLPLMMKKKVIPSRLYHSLEILDVYYYLILPKNCIRQEDHILFIY